MPKLYKKRLSRKGRHLLIKRGSNKAVANLLGLTMLEVKRNAKHFGMTDTEVLEQMVHDKLKQGIIRQIE
jgi:hypothetical protein